MKRLTLKKRHETAQTKYGFSKGIAWWQFLRITFVLLVISTILYPANYFRYILDYPLVATICWLIVVVLTCLYGYSLYAVPKKGFLFILLHFVFSPLLLFVYDELSLYLITGQFYIDISIVFNIIAKIIASSINIYYFHNRKVLFDMELIVSIAETDYVVGDMKPTTQFTPIPPTNHSNPAQTLQYNKDVDINSKSNWNYKQDSIAYSYTAKTDGTDSCVPMKPISSTSHVASETVVKQPQKRLSKGALILIIFLSTFLAVLIIGISVYVGIQIGEVGKSTANTNPISTEAPASKPTDYIAKDYKKTVYVIEENGNWSYHDSDCEIISGIPYSINSMTKQNAVQYGYHRCNKCKP